MEEFMKIIKNLDPEIKNKLITLFEHELNISYERGFNEGSQYGYGEGFNEGAQEVLSSI